MEINEQGGGKYKKEDTIQQIIKMKIEKLCSTRTIFEFLTKDLGYAQSYSYELMKEASQYLADIYKNNNINALEEAISELEEQREAARYEKNRKLVLEISREIYKLKQLYVERVQHSGEIQIKTNWGDDTKDNSTI